MNTIAKSPAPYLGNNDELGDTEMVDAVAPGATLDIILVPADTTSSVANFAAVFTGYNAGPGWDPVTGWGSPDAQYLVPLLAHQAHPIVGMTATSVRS